MPSIEGDDDISPRKHYGVRGSSDSDKGVYGDSKSGFGVFGTSCSLNGVYGGSDTSNGVRGESNADDGVYGAGYLNGVHGKCDSGNGVAGESDSGNGVAGESDSGNGVAGESDSGNGVKGDSKSGVGVYGSSNGSPWGGVGVVGESHNGDGVHGISYVNECIGVRGDSYGGPNNVGVYGNTTTGTGVIGFSDGRTGVFGKSWNSSGEGIDVSGVVGVSISSGYGVFGFSNNGIGVYGTSKNGQFAAVLDGNVNIVGRLHKAGGSFKIDHPLDPANKYLYHSFVESPDMKNIYDGIIVLDDKGESEIELPDWFGVLNKDFRYQLTAIGAPGPNLYVAKEISDVTTAKDNGGGNNKNSRFKIAGGNSGMRVSWQVTGIRKDPWANANRIKVEEDKSAKEQGYYIYPDLYGQPEDKGISNLLYAEGEKQKWFMKENK